MSITLETLKVLGKTLKTCCFQREKNNSKPKKEISWAEPLTSVKYFAVESNTPHVMPKDASNMKVSTPRRYTHGENLGQDSNTDSWNDSQIQTNRNFTRELVQMSLSTSDLSVTELDKMFTMGKVIENINFDGLEEEWV